MIFGIFLTICIAGLSLLFLKRPIFGLADLQLQKKVGSVASAIAGTLAVLSLLFGYASPGYYYLVQYPSGGQKAIMVPGPYWTFGGQVIEFKQFLTVAFDDANDSHDVSGVSPPQSIRFRDSMDASLHLTERFELPSDPEQFKAMANSYRSQKNLIQATLIPTTQEAIRNSARMYSGQEYISGNGGDFEEAIFDQVQNGTYMLDLITPHSLGGDVPITQADVRTVDQDKVYSVTVVPRKGKNGELIRKEAPFKRFGIKLTQLNVQNVDPDGAFKKKLDAQRDVSAELALERGKALKEDERKRRIISQGEADKAQTRVDLEKKQIEIVVQAETQAKEAEQLQKQRLVEAETAEKAATVNERTKVIELRNAELDAKKTIVAAEADANKRKLVMAADNALGQRLEAYVRVNELYAEALKDKPLVPSVMVGGGANGSIPNSSDVTSMFMALIAKDLAVKVTAEEKK